MFTECLKTTLIDKLTTLDEFMTHVSKGLDVEVEGGRGGKAALMHVMEDIRDVRKAMNITQELFVPLQNILHTLRAHGMDMLSLPTIGDLSIQDYLDEAPMAWDKVLKKTFKKKEDILPMQTSEVESLKVNLEQFFLSVREFRNKFRAEAPFTFVGSPAEAYTMLVILLF